MVDTIKLNKILPSLSPARKVKRTDPRERNNPQSSFKETFERKHKKKKKDDPEPVVVPEREIAARALPRNRPADRSGADKGLRLRDSSCSKIIDIRV